MDLDVHMSDALCNCFGQADAFLNTFLDYGKVTRGVIKKGAIKVTMWTDLGSKIAGHSLVCVLDGGVIRICQAFYDSRSRFKHTHTLSKHQTRHLLQSLQRPAQTVKILTSIVPELGDIFEATDAIQVDIEKIRIP